MCLTSLVMVAKVCFVRIFPGGLYDGDPKRRACSHLIFGEQTAHDLLG